MTTELPAEVHLAWGAASHRGARRLLNEDRFLVSRSVFFVADGMGGHEAGEVASATAVEALRPLADLDVVTPEEVRDRIAVAQENVQAIVTEPGRGAGTTVTGVVVSEQDGNPYWLVVNVGDSRTYHLAGGHLEQVSVDHSEVQEMVDAGLLTPAEALTHPRRHVVTRCCSRRPTPRQPPSAWSTRPSRPAGGITSQSSSSMRRACPTTRAAGARLRATRPERRVRTSTRTRCPGMFVCRSGV